MLLGGSRLAKGVLVRKSLSQIAITRDIRTACKRGVSGRERAVGGARRAYE